MIRVLLAEDQAMVRGALVTMLGLEGDVDVVSEVGRGDEIVPAAPEPEKPLDWLTEDDLDVYTAAYERTGFTPALNVYRNFDWDWEDLPGVGTIDIDQPCLFIGGRRDPAVYFTQQQMDPFVAAVPNLQRIVLLPGCGHWIQQERPDDLNAELIDFLRRNSGT